MRGAVSRAFVGRLRRETSPVQLGAPFARGAHGRLYAVTISLFLALALLAALALSWVLRTAQLIEVQRNLDQLSTMIAEQVSRSLQLVDITLQDTVHRVEIAAARAGSDPETYLVNPEVRSILLEHARRVELLDGLTLVNASGQVVNTSRPMGRLPVYVGDRSYFTALQHDPAPDIYVSAPVISRFTGVETVFLSRRLDFGTAAFHGIVLGAIPLSGLTASLRQATAIPQVAITLERQDHTVLARVSMADAAADLSSGALTATSAAAGDALRVVVSMSGHDALASWRRQAIGISIAAFTVSACLLLMLFALLRQFRAERAAQAALTRRNAELEVARNDLERRTTELEQSAAALRIGEHLLAERSATLNTTLEHITQGIMMVDAAGRVRVYNQRAVELLGLPEELLAGSPTLAEVLQFQLDGGEFDQAEQSIVDFVHSGGISSAFQLYKRVRPNGRVIEFSTVLLSGGGMVRTYTDVTDLQRAQEQIERTALFDELTGLPNRLSLRRTLQRELDQRVDGDKLGLLYINLDRFRLLNDARGHGLGDQILVKVAQRLQALARGGDFVGRTGGDEFVIMHKVRADPPDTVALGHNLLRLLGESYVIDGRRVALTASIGLAVSSANTTPDVLLRNSEIAMYRAKDAGRNQLCRYEAAMATAQEEQFQLEQSLRESLGTAAFRLVYQPIVSLETNEIKGFEALLRWTDRVRGEVAPGLFIPLAEATGLVVPLGRSVLEWACLEAASWSDARTIAVNLSPAQFQGGGLPRVVREILAQTGLPADRLELEVTEGMLLEDTGPVHETMFALRDIGVSLTLDDFGTGHAGLSSLRRFPFSKIKIDQSFIRNLGTDGESDVIVEEMLSLGHRLGMQVVAEGVELESQLERLRSLGCAYVQGFLTGRPVAPEVARHL